MEDNYFGKESMIHFNDWVPSLPEPEHKKAGRHMGGSKNTFWRDYKILIIAAAVFSIYSLILIWRVDARAVKRVRTEELAPVQAELVKTQEKLKKYTDKEEEQTRQYFLSGDASKDAQNGRDSIELAKDGGVWKNKAAFQAYCWNVKLRQLSSSYPNNIKECLAQPYQYDFYNENGFSDEAKQQWALEVLQQADSGTLPAHLSLNHLYLEMKDGGATCVLHTDDNYYSSKDDPWKLKE